MHDPIVRLAHLRIIKLSHDLDRQLANRRDCAPVLEILHRLQDRAAESLAALATCDTEDPKAIRLLQNEVKRYDEWVGWLREIMSEGVDYDKEISAEERDEMIDMLTQTPDGAREAMELGLINLDQHDA